MLQLTTLLGLFPLALFVSLAKNRTDWKQVGKGLFLGILGIALLSIAALAIHAVQWHPKLPTFAPLRYWNNFALVAIPEEGFYRGFLQNELCLYLKNKKGGKALALLLSSLIFTLSHMYWSPSLAILSFVFLSSILYGSVYLVTGTIESAILCHFLLNAAHMTLFSYHAM